MSLSLYNPSLCHLSPFYLVLCPCLEALSELTTLKGPLCYHNFFPNNPCATKVPHNLIQLRWLINGWALKKLCCELVKQEGGTKNSVNRA